MALLCRLGRSAVVAGSVLTLMGCATLSVNSYLQRGIDVRQYRTFAWGPVDALHTGDPRLDNNEFFDEWVRGDIRAQLAARGYEEITSGAPDLLVHYHANVTQEIDVREVDREYRYCEEADCRPYVYEAGSLLVDLMDPRTNKVVWRGWAKGGIEGVIDNQRWMEERVDEVVARIFESLPRRL